MNISTNKIHFSKNRKIFYFLGTNKFEFKNLIESELHEFNLKQKIFYGEQTHSDKLKIIDSDLFQKKITEIKDVDSLISSKNNTVLAIKTADCFPILIFDEEKPLIAAIHAGREGIRLDLISKTIKNIDNPSNLKAIVGAGISSKNYEVDKNTFEKFVKDTKIEQKEYNIDLKKVIKSQLLNSKLVTENIFFSEDETDKNYFSYRFNKTSKRQISFIGII